MIDWLDGRLSTDTMKAWVNVRQSEYCGKSRVHQWSQRHIRLEGAVLPQYPIFSAACAYGSICCSGTLQSETAPRSIKP